MAMHCYLVILLLACHRDDVLLQHPPLVFVDAFAPLAPLCIGSRRTVNTSSTDSVGPTHANRLESKAGVLTKVALAPSPSGIDAWPQSSQAAVFVGTYAALGLATYPTTKGLEALSQVLGLERWRNSVIDTTLPLLLGLVYAAAGLGHFANAAAFRDIYPPPGTWGLWYLPGSPAFHVAWTGAVEFAGGLGLLLSGLGAVGADDNERENVLVKFLVPLSATVLFLLTVAVTPANIYMFTHGAVLGEMPPLAVSFHAVRFAVQVAFLSLLLTLARDGFFFAWGDELD